MGTRTKTSLALLLCALSATTATPVRAQPDILPQDRAPATWRFPDGLTVTRIPQQLQDMERLLEIKTWKFRLQFTRPNTGLSCRLELREEGQEPIFLGSAADNVHNTQEAAELTIGIVPSEERLEFDVPKRVRITSWFGDNGVTSLAANPFAKFSGPYDDLGSNEVRDAIPLLRGE